MFSLLFWKLAFERAIKTAAQVAAVIVGANQFNFLQADWITIVGLAGGGFVASIFTSIASLSIGDNNDPSLIKK